jgi:hypothetical protein
MTTREPLEDLRDATERMEAEARPAPAAMLGEALRHLRTADASLSDAYRGASDEETTRLLCLVRGAIRLLEQRTGDGRELSR